MSFVREAPNVRHVEILHGDTLRRIALRELGSASLWTDIAIANGLRPPYISDVSSAGVLAYGEIVKVAAPNSLLSADSDPDKVYGTDILVGNGLLSVSGGDLAMVSGIENFLQAIRHHVVVDKRELEFHPEFGCHVRSLIGASSGPVSGQLAAFYVKSAIIEDARVKSVASCIAIAQGDVIRVTASVIPVSGRPVDIVVVI